MDQISSRNCLEVIDLSEFVTSQTRLQGQSTGSSLRAIDTCSTIGIESSAFWVSEGACRSLRCGAFDQS